MKKLVVLLAIMALCLVAAPVMADSDSWVGGNVSGGAGVYGIGDAWTNSYMYGDGGSNTSTGGTWTDMSADMFGRVSASYGAGMVSGGVDSYAGAYEGQGYTGSYAGSYSSMSANTSGNASAYGWGGAYADADAWNY